ncbi:uncharacterized protein N0V89_010747 [Didymosphaeria variabile]|uniref:ATP-dependent DNA ligase family profile domain-containing protein n=1 Tax=Didymosphaeria variabile TaxID=1932322 RepID=A0A9W8XBY3_9PLEO|nr:uncharacterized protein N0V89_010747 [Didymosphaeria variabile]KAJ4346815.1 hypothetical protein N0V89_010747 [Didymosphaeria variabile]
MVLAFGDVCALLEGAEKIATRRPRCPPDEVEKRIRQHVARWFKERREDLALGWYVTPNAKIRQTHAHKTYSIGTFSTRIKRAIPMERVDNLLTQLAAKYRFSDLSIQKQREWHMSTDTELKYILRRLESWEAKWFVRLLLREYTTISLDETYVFWKYHFLLPDLLKFQNEFDAALRILREELSRYPPAPEPSLESQMRSEAARLLKAAVGVKVARPPFHKAWSFKHCFQLVGNRAWAAEVKYDGEYCEIHVDVESAPNDIKIFSKNGKDATEDRRPLHGTIRNALRIGHPECTFRRNCIILAEMVLYSDRERKILSFSKIRKHIKRSGSFLGTLQDSHPHAWEHLMLVFFDVLVLDDEPIMRQCLQKRRRNLRDLVKIIPGRSVRSQWTLLDFKSEHGITDLKQAFARSLVEKQEGLILKPLGVPYFPLHSEAGVYQPGYFIKFKKDYLGDMGGQRDLGDFAIIGACYNPQVASKTDLKPLHWTHFHVGCITNKLEIQRSRAKPNFKVVGCLSLDKQIPKSDLKYLNQVGRLHQVDLGSSLSIDAFDLEHSKGFERRMTVAFKVPFVAEILGSGYEKMQNETFEMLRHPRVKKIHLDRTWEDAVSMDELQLMAGETWSVPDAKGLDGHARDVALLMKKYLKENEGSQITTSECETTQDTTQRSEASTINHTDSVPKDAIVQETQQNSLHTRTTLTSSQCSGSTQANGTCTSKEFRSILVREDTSERLRIHEVVNSNPTPPISSGVSISSTRSSPSDIISPPSSKRRRTLAPLADAGGNRNLGSFDYDSQTKIIHIYAEEGLKVQVHNRPHIDD